MSSVNYSLNHRGVRLVSASEAYVKGKNGNIRLNPKYHFVGKIDTHMPNMILSTTKDKKPRYRGDVMNLNSIAKRQIVDYFFDDTGKRNAKSKVYLGIPLVASQDEKSAKKIIKNKTGGGF
jgi:hypothetical protein